MELIHKYPNKKNYMSDVRFGIQSETKTLKKIRMALEDETIKKYSHNYSVLDFHSTKNKTICEVKGRRNKKNAYPTTMVGLNKIKEAKIKKENGFDIFFFFDFKDGLYYFSMEDWETIESHKYYQCREGGTYRRGVAEIKMYCYIPVSLLKKVDAEVIHYIKTEME